MEFFLDHIVGPILSAASVIVTVLMVADRNRREDRQQAQNMHQQNSERLGDIENKVGVIETKVTAMWDRFIGNGQR